MKDKKLIKTLAWIFYQNSRVCFDDLLQEATLAYHKGIKTYNPKYGKVSTYVWHTMHNHLMNYILSEAKHTAHRTREEIVHKASTNTPQIWELLPHELQKALEILMEHAEEIDCRFPADARRQMRIVLFRHGYTREQVRAIQIGLKNYTKRL